MSKLTRGIWSRAVQKKTDGGDPRPSFSSDFQSFMVIRQPPILVLDQSDRIRGICVVVLGFFRGFGAEKFQFGDMENEFSSGGAIGFLESPRLRASGDQEMHPLLDVRGKFFTPLAPDLGRHPIGELALADAAIAGEIDVENLRFSGRVDEFHGTDISC